MMFIDLDGFKLQEACRGCVVWRASGHPHLHVALNASALQFQHDDSLGVVADTLVAPRAAVVLKSLNCANG